MSILVTGARGSIGSAVLAGLLGSGAAVRASSRDPQRPGLPDGVDAVRLDLGDPATYADALHDVQVVFLYADERSPEAFAAAARAAGVEHVVLLSSHSVLAVDTEQNPVAQRHLRAERALIDAGPPWTFVRPGYFATNTLRWATIRTERVLRTAFPDARSSPVHERDIAEVAVAACTDAVLASRALLVPGAGAITLREQVAAIAAAIGEPVHVDEVGVERYRAELLRALPPALVDRLIATRGEIAEAPQRIDAVPLVLGRPSLTYAEWARDHADHFR